MENKIPLAVRYRPKKLDDVVGQDVVVRILKNSFKSKDWHHAYILAGAKGTGKTTTARIMAAMENCEHSPTMEPCGKCKNCLDIYNETSIDVREVDAASNRSINDIRAMKENIHNCPIQCRYKYYIIDEAHGLSGEAADAALKMIEEPPPFVRFILATTEPEAFKSTIPSRCLTLNFRNIDKPILSDYLTKVCQSENIKCEDDALKVISNLADNSARNALQNLQIALAYAGDEPITAEFAQKALGAIDEIYYFQLVQNILSFNAPEAMKCLNQIVAKECSMRRVISGLLNHLRHLQLYLIMKDEVKDFGVSDEEIKRLAYQAQKAKPSIVAKMVGFIVDVQRGLYVNMDAVSMLENLFIVPSIIEAVKAKKEETIK